MSDIFISYASADRPRVKPLVDELQRRGWSVWWDRTIPPGKTWDQVIEAALDEARCVIVLWSRESVKSDWVRTEADEARQRGILVPARIDDVAIPLAFRRIQAANLIDWSGHSSHAEFDELARAITDVLTRGTPVFPVAPIQEQPEQPRAGTGRPRNAMAIMGGALLAALAGFASYSFSNRPSDLKPALINPSASPASSQVKAEPRTEQTDSRLPAKSAAKADVIKPQGAKAESPQEKTEVKTTEHGISNLPVFKRAFERLAREPRTNPKDGLTYVFIPPGKFMMGCSPGDNECSENENPAHAEQIVNGFWMGQTEVTQAAWKKANVGPGDFKDAQLPVDFSDSNSAVAYCKAIGGRLPTETEWEYAARGGVPGPRYGVLDTVAWYTANSGGSSHPAGLKGANAFGLYDMLGNVSEWTRGENGKRGIRGGSFDGASSDMRASFREAERPAGRDTGFRCVWEQ